MTPWRQGRKVPQNVYEGDKPIAQFHDAETAARVVEAVNNAARAHAEGLEAGRAAREVVLLGYRKAVVQIGILRDRMEGCDSLTDDRRRDQDGHALSLFEVPAWVAEHDQILESAGGPRSLIPAAPEVPATPGKDS